MTDAITPEQHKQYDMTKLLDVPSNGIMVLEYTDGWMVYKIVKSAITIVAHGLSSQEAAVALANVHWLTSPITLNPQRENTNMTADPYTPEELSVVIKELRRLQGAIGICSMAECLTCQHRKRLILSKLPRLLATVEALVADAARYRFLKSCAVLDSEGWWAFETPIEFPGQEFNEAIDAARKGTP